MEKFRDLGSGIIAIPEGYERNDSENEKFR